MKTEIAEAIKALTAKVKSSEKADDALKFSQAALNLAHAHATVVNTQFQLKQTD